MSPLDIHFAPTPNGWKISIMIEELREAGVSLPEVRLHMVNLMHGDQFSDEFTAINPNQKIPAMEHNGRAIMESGAILQYLGETFPSTLLPMDEQRWNVLPWVYWQAANLGPVFGNKLSYTRYIDAPDVEKKHPLERFEKEGHRLLAALDRQLCNGPFVCGDQFTIADITILPWIRAYKWVKIDITNRPHVLAWLNHCLDRPGVARGVAYGVPQDEVDRFSQARRADYARGGASIASNDRLKTEL